MDIDFHLFCPNEMHMCTCIHTEGICSNLTTFTSTVFLRHSNAVSITVLFQNEHKLFELVTNTSKEKKSQNPREDV